LGRANVAAIESVSVASRRWFVFHECGPIDSARVREALRERQSAIDDRRELARIDDLRDLGEFLPIRSSGQLIPPNAVFSIRAVACVIMQAVNLGIRRRRVRN
jgi:hypothetical protein